MAPGIGGFNIDAPMQKARLAKGDIAVAQKPPLASPGPNLVFHPPLQAQRMVVNVESNKSSLVPRLLAIIAIGGVLLLGLGDEIRNQLSDRLQTIAPLCKVSARETSVRQSRLLILPFDISLKSPRHVAARRPPKTDFVRSNALSVAQNDA